MRDTPLPRPAQARPVARIALPAMPWLELLAFSVMIALAVAQGV